MNAEPLDEDAAPNRPVFGDPQWIAQRGPATPPPKIRPKPSRKWKRYQPVWQRIEGAWTRLKCRECESRHFIITAQKDPFIELDCVSGHRMMCLVGFLMHKPGEIES